MTTDRVKASLKSPVSAAATAGKILQRQCSCGNHTVAGGECDACRSKKLPALQRKIRIGSSDDPLEREADSIAEQVMNGRASAPISSALAVQRSSTEPAPSPEGVPGAVRQAVSGVGTPLTPDVRRDMEERFGRDFSAVRIHTGSAADSSAEEIDAKAYTLGHHLVFANQQFRPESLEGRRLLAHELTHVVQQTGAGSEPAKTPQRKVILKGAEMSSKERQTFLKGKKWASKRRATEVIEDMAGADDKFDFKDEAELETEIVKRVSTVQHMIESQTSSGTKEKGVRSGFGYPFTGESVLYGPRVNYAARDFWEPGPPDGYALRTDKKKNETLIKSPRRERCKVYGDQCSSYSFKLTDKGKADPYHAIAYLFSQQPAHKRSLIHCDYLVSVVNFMSFADSIKESEFNKRVAAYGPQKIVLRWNAFEDLQTEFFAKVRVGSTDQWVRRAGMGSLQKVSPTSEKDLVVGDHVIFYNHLAYDLINRKIGNAWRLENAVLIEKNKQKKDVFLGHGSGRKTADELRAKLAEEFNDVAKPALDLVAKTKSKNKKIADDARATLASKYPKIEEAGNEWRIRGSAGLCTSVQIDEKLRLIKASDVIGLKDPCDQSKLEAVQRPVESAK